VAAPSVALAQPAPSSPPPPNGPPPGNPAPYDPNAGSGPYAPAPNGPAPGQPPPPPGGYGQPTQPNYGYQPYQYQQAPVSVRSGMTFEANLGLGWIRVSPDGEDSDTSDVGLGGLCLGVGGWVSPKLAITARLAGATVFDTIMGADFRYTNAFFGGSAQYWVDDHFWFGGGAGLGVYALHVDYNGESDGDSINGFALDMRAGYTFSATTESTWNVSFELNPAFYSDNGQDATVTSIAILGGYQHL
jgi:hypothetical protein